METYNLKKRSDDEIKKSIITYLSSINKANTIQISTNLGINYFELKLHLEEMARQKQVTLTHEGHNKMWSIQP